MKTAKLNKMLDDLGFRESTAGTNDIRRAVDIVADNHAAMMCKDVYPALAGGDRAEMARIERRMRGAIATAMQSPNWDNAWRNLGGWGKPTNSELIRRLAREAVNAD